jgi:phosphoribosylanthranilate isomerase
MTFIKFCGMTRPQDIAVAVELGVDAIGLVLWPQSPRHVSLEVAAKLVAMIPARIRPVGVFVAPSRDEVSRAIAHVGIRVAQLHGVTDVGFKGLGCEFWIAASLPTDGTDISVEPGPVLILDAHDPVKQGGTGRTIDWQRASAVAATRPVILAGGLTPANVGDAIRTVRPWGVDVASGIETSAGVKSEPAMRAFVTAVRREKS